MMKALFKDIYHWTTFHEGIQDTVHSYYIINKKTAFLIDPRIPQQGLQWFKKQLPPSHIYLTNRLHYRHSADFVREFNCKVWCQRKGLKHFSKQQQVNGFSDKQRLPGGVMALNIDVLCPEESVLHIPLAGGILAIADAIIRERGKLKFVADELLGDNPEAIKQGLLKQFRQLLRRKFEHLFFAHGQPVIGQGKEALRDFIENYSVT